MLLLPSPQPLLYVTVSAEIRKACGSILASWLHLSLTKQLQMNSRRRAEPFIYSKIPEDPSKI